MDRRGDRRRGSGERGSASVEHAGLVATVALLAVLALAAIAADGEIEPGRELGATIARRLVCAPRLPGACRHHPLVPAYGWPLARLTRALAPAPHPRTGPGGLPLMPVDFRRCRHAGCAVDAGPHVTASNRRVTVFTQMEDERRATGAIAIVYWMYRPTIGWDRVVRRASRADVAAAAGTPVLKRDDPALVPLETLPGRDQYDFPAVEEPPWRWRIRSRYPGWSS